MSGNAVALVTGAASGVGRATALTLSREGFRVACVDTDEQGLSDVVDEVRALGTDALAVRCDLRELDDVKEAVDAIRQWGGRLDKLANCAGVASSEHYTELSLSDWHNLIEVNLTGTFLITQQCLPLLLESRGAVVNVSSIGATQGRPYMAAYCASKGGVEALTRALAAEYAGRGVRFNTVAPGSVDTPLRRALPGRIRPGLEGADASLTGRGWALIAPGVASPMEIASGIAYLLSVEARFITGTSLVIDGGATVI